MKLKEMAYPPGMVRHGSTYRIQKKVPKDCIPHFGGKTILYLKTETADKKEAAAAAWKWLAELEQQFDRIRKTGSPFKTTISDDELEYLAALMASSTLAAD
ncbi:MAG: DUF6538 domain-containing protein, partial [Pseudomonadota bacterium]